MTATIAVLSLLLPPLSPPSPAVSQPRLAVSEPAPIQAPISLVGPPSARRVDGYGVWAGAALWGRVTPRPGPTPLYSDYPKETPWPDVAVTAESPAPAPTDAAPIAEPNVPLTLRERALNRLSELGAPAWVVAAFDCIGRNESGWTNARSRTGDSGVLQINDVHRPELARLGLDPWVPEDAATFAWRLFTRAGWSFRDWTVAPWCGLR